MMPSEVAHLSATDVLQTRRDLTLFVNTLSGHARLVLADLDSLPAPQPLVHAGQSLVAACVRVAEQVEQASQQWHQTLRVDLADLHAATSASLEQIAGLTQTIASSASDRGAEFSSDLARVRLAAERLRARLVSRHRPLRHMNSGITGTQPSVLVVDDQVPSAKVTTRRLQRAGFTSIVTVHSGQEALARLRTQAVDVVLLDVMMPDLPGVDVLAEIKIDPNLRDIPVIMLSAVDDEAMVVRCVELGADDYLIKPCDATLLYARMASSLERKQLRDRDRANTRQIERDRSEIERLLHTILPPAIAQELRETGNVQPKRFENVAVLFADVVGFTAWCESRTPEAAHARLQELVEIQEDIAMRHGLEKIKTIGDAFLAVGGLLQPLEHPVLSTIRAGLDMVRVAPTLPAGWSLRVGIHVGPLQAGVVGRNTYFFDVWGDTVNTAARVQAHGVADAVVVSRSAWHQVREQCEGTSLGSVTPKGLATMELYRVERA